MVQLGLNPLRSLPGVEATTLRSRSRSRMTTPSLDRSTVVVGDVIEGDTKMLVQELLADDEPAAAIIKVVSIVGAGGMGKSTLAKNIFNHGDIQAGFAVKIWLSVTDSYDVEKLSSSATEQGLSPSRTGKLLLVMDDVWSKNHPWAAFLPIINNGAAARVIITTRDEDLLEDITTRDIAPLKHRVNPLQPQDAWSLLKQQVMYYCSQNVDSEDVDRLEDIGKGIAKKCDGSPLAIKVIGGLLKKNVTERHWKNVLDEPLWSTDKTQHEVINSVLRLSYDDLSPPLKQCFLYYSLFPKGLVMRDSYIVGMWMSEGFLGNRPGDRRTRKQIEEDGLDYYADLIQANLIEPAPQIARDGSVSKMHDVIRSFAHKIAEEELLVVGPGQNSWLESSPGIWQLSVESTELESSSMALPEWSSISGNHKLLRSLIINGRVKFDTPTAATKEPTLSSFPSLRALHVRHAETERFVESLCSLRHLRFLHLDSTDITRLPDGIGKLRFLQHIGLDNCRNFGGELPTSFLELERLTSLKVDATECIVPKGFGVLTGLRTLSLFPVQMDGDWCSLQELGQLEELVRLEIRGLAAVPSGGLAAKARICDKEELVVLVLMCYNYNPPELSSISEEMREECQRIEEVFDQLCPPRLLESLVLKGYMGRRPPSWMCVGGMTTAAIDLNSLTTLEMVRLPFCRQLPDGLCRLPSLKRLEIDSALSMQHVGPEFQRHSRITTGNSIIAECMWRSSFPKLEFLRFEKLPRWEEWEWDEEEAQANKDSIIAMPRLQQLRLMQCNLRHLPAGLASSNRRALRELVLWDLPCITSLENIPSVKELNVARCPRLRIIRGLANLRGVSIERCPALEVLEDVPALDTMHWKDPTVYELPDYLWGLRLNVLHLYCNPELTRALASGNYRKGNPPICDDIRVTPVEVVVVVHPAAGGSSSTSTA